VQKQNLKQIFIENDIFLTHKAEIMRFFKIVNFCEKLIDCHKNNVILGAKNIK